MTEAKDYGEPWGMLSLSQDRHYGLTEVPITKSLDEDEILLDPDKLERAVDCVNACRGFGPQEMRNLTVAFKILSMYIAPQEELRLQIFDAEGREHWEDIECLLDGDDPQFTPDQVIIAARKLWPAMPELKLLEEKRPNNVPRG